MAFSKGKSGNPGGRPKKENSLTGILEELSNAPPKGQRKTRKVLLAETLYELALSGDIPAIKYIYDRIDGKPTEYRELEHSGIEPITIRVINGDD